MKFRKTIEAILLGSFLAAGKLSAQEPYKQAIISGFSIKTELSLPPENAGISAYIFKKKEIVSDSANPAMYIIFQGHHTPDEKMTLEKGISIVEALETQFSIYHILDYLHKEKNVYCICTESILFNDSFDIKNPGAFLEAAGKNKDLESTIDSLKQGKDLGLLKIIASPDFYSGVFFPLIYEDVFLTGFEDEKNIELFAVMNFYENHPELHEIMRKHYENYVMHVNKQRSLDVIRYCPANAEKLYDEKLIPNKNLAVVIGAWHSGDYQNLVQEIRQEKRNINLILIYPKGIEKYEGFVDYFENY